MDIQNILSRLIESGLTQKDIAEAVGCSQPTISDMASGKTGKSRPSWKIVEGLRALAEKHGVSSPASIELIPGAPIDGKKVREAKNGVRAVITDTRKLRE